MHAATLDHQAYDPRPSIPHQEVMALLDQKIHTLKSKIQISPDWSICLAISNSSLVRIAKA